MIIEKNYLSKNSDVILRFEPFFKKNVITAIINHSEKTIRPAHGYFIPHKYGKLNKKYAEKIDYIFIND